MTDGVVRLLNTARGPALCLAGRVDAGTVDEHVRRYGREPMPVAVIDAGSVTGLSASAVDLVLAHLHAAERAGRAVRVRRSPPVERLLQQRDGARPVTGQAPLAPPPRLRDRDTGSEGEEPPWSRP